MTVWWGDQLRDRAPGEKWTSGSVLRLRHLSWLLVVLPLNPARADDSPLSLVDLAAYRRALDARVTDPQPATVSFRQLWEHPERYEGKQIQVEGQVVRRFQQESFGTFPALVEAWAVTSRGEPYCLVYPASRNHDATSPRGLVRFVGTYIKRIRYQGGDVDRLAPLIVGPGPPVLPPRPASRPPVRRRSINDWILAGVAALVVGAVIAWQRLQAPGARTSRLGSDPDPEFESPKPGFSDPEPRQESP